MPRYDLLEQDSRRSGGRGQVETKRASVNCKSVNQKRQLQNVYMPNDSIVQQVLSPGRAAQSAERASEEKWRRSRQMINLS